MKYTVPFEGYILVEANSEAEAADKACDGNYIQSTLIWHDPELKEV